MSNTNKLRNQGIKAVNELVKAVTINKAQTVVNLQKLIGTEITKETPFEVTGMTRKSFINARQRYLKGKNVK